MIGEREYEFDDDKDQDPIHAIEAAKLQPLAKLRRDTLAHMGVIKANVMHIQNKMGCVAIGISPRDDVLSINTPEELTKLINRIIIKWKPVGKAGAKVPPSPLALIAVGEYSPNFRWHYHGIVYIENVDLLDKLKSLIQRRIGRVKVEQIKYIEYYANYMGKQYTQDIKVYYPFSHEKCIIQIIRDIPIGTDI